MRMLDDVIALKKYNSVKKDVQKFSAAKPNQETYLAQVIQKKKRTVMLLGKIASKKIASVRTKRCKLGNTKENRERELERVK